MDRFLEFSKNYIEYCWHFFSAFGNIGNRLFLGFICVSALFAYGVYRSHKKSGKTTGSFIAFLFPKSVWSNPSAWLDLRYFFFHGLIGHFIVGGTAIFATLFGVFIGTGFIGDAGLATVSPHAPALTIIIAAIVLIIINLVSDFIGFYVHYLQHKIPVLWQFHKVHHAGEVMHPLSNYREHPIDNLTYNLVTNLCAGISLGALWRLFGYIPSNATILGVSIFGLVFNLSAYHLRHSHIWLRWPGIWSKIFASPAHHHVHHSRHPDHLDKNFAFIFPFWDVLFKTYHMPEDNRDIEFGIVEDSSELNSCVNLYLIPFRDAYRVMQGTYKKTPSPELSLQEKIS